MRARGSFRITNYYYTAPEVSTYYYPRTATYGYFDNPYKPYWSYRGPLGQGSGHDVRIGH